MLSIFHSKSELIIDKLQNKTVNGTVGKIPVVNRPTSNCPSKLKMVKRNLDDQDTTLSQDKTALENPPGHLDANKMQKDKGGKVQETIANDQAPISDAENKMKGQSGFNQDESKGTSRQEPNPDQTQQLMNSLPPVVPLQEPESLSNSNPRLNQTKSMEGMVQSEPKAPNQTQPALNSSIKHYPSQPSEVSTPPLEISATYIPFMNQSNLIMSVTPSEQIVTEFMRPALNSSVNQTGFKSATSLPDSSQLFQSELETIQVTLPVTQVSEHRGNQSSRPITAPPQDGSGPTLDLSSLESRNDLQQMSTPQQTVEPKETPSQENQHSTKPPQTEAQESATKELKMNAQVDSRTPQQPEMTREAKTTESPQHQDTMPVPVAQNTIKAVELVTEMPKFTTNKPMTEAQAKPQELLTTIQIPIKPLTGQPESVAILSKVTLPIEPQTAAKAVEYLKPPTVAAALAIDPPPAETEKIPVETFQTRKIDFPTVFQDFPTITTKAVNLYSKPLETSQIDSESLPKLVVEACSQSTFKSVKNVVEENLCKPPTKMENITKETIQPKNASGEESKKFSDDFGAMLDAGRYRRDMIKLMENLGMNMYQVKKSLFSMLKL